MKRSDFLKILGISPFAGTAILSSIAKIDEPIPPHLHKHSDINSKHCLIKDSDGQEVALISDFELNINDAVDELGRLLFKEWDIEFEGTQLIQDATSFMNKCQSRDLLTAIIRDTDGSILFGRCYVSDISIDSPDDDYSNVYGRLIGNGALFERN